MTMTTEMRIEANYCESFEALVNKYERRLYVYALQMLRNPEDAEEAVQDAFVKAYRAWAKSDAQQPPYTRLSAWFFKITLNVVRNRLRRKRFAQVSVEDLDDSASSRTPLEDRLSPDVILDRHASIDLIERAIRELPSHLLEAARLRFIEGLTHSEIAKRCSQPEGTIKSHVFRAKRLLRQALKPAFA